MESGSITTQFWPAFIPKSLIAFRALAMAEPELPPRKETSKLKLDSHVQNLSAFVLCMYGNPSIFELPTTLTHHFIEICSIICKKNQKTTDVIILFEHSIFNRYGNMDYTILMSPTNFLLYSFINS